MEEKGRPTVLCYSQGDDRRRPNVVVCFHDLDCFDTACRKDGPGARKVVLDLIAAFVGPLALLVLLILGDAERPARAN